MQEIKISWNINSRKLGAETEMGPILEQLECRRLRIHKNNWQNRLKQEFECII